MTCPFEESGLHAFVDGELPPDERAAFEKHLSDCPACRGKVEKLRRLRAAARALGRAVPGDEYFRRLRSRIEAATIRRKPAFTLRRALLAAAACVAVVLFVVFAIPRAPEAPRAPGVVTPVEPGAVESASVFDLEEVLVALREAAEEDGESASGEPEDFSLESALEDVLGEEVALVAGGY